MKILAIAAALLITAMVQADSPASEASIRHLMALTRFDQVVDERLVAHREIKKVDVIRSASDVAAEFGFAWDDPRARMLRDEASSEVVKLFGVELSTESVVGEMVRVYAQTYTEEEVQAQIAFYSSPVGRKVVATGQSLIGQVNGVVTVRANSLGPRIGVLLDEVRARAQELKTTQVPVSK